MSFSSMLRSCSAATVLIAIRAAAHEPPPARFTKLPHDPWQGSDPYFRTAWAGVAIEVPA